MEGNCSNKKKAISKILNAPNVKSTDYVKHYLPGPMFGPYSFINVSGGKEELDDVGHSWKNMVEVAVVIKIVQKLYKAWTGTKQNMSIGVVSPYTAQVDAIQKKLGLKYDKLDGFSVKVKSIEGFQCGDEDVIILSTVRSNSKGSTGFLSNPQTTNVALTRTRHSLWILGNGRTLTNSGSVWKTIVHDAKDRHCFFDADEDEDLAILMLEVKKELNQFDDLLTADCILFKNARWKVIFSDNFRKSFDSLNSSQTKKLVIYLLLRLSSGWRPKKKNVDLLCDSSSQILKLFKVKDLYIVCSVDVVKELCYIQILKVWDILPLENIQNLVERLDSIFGTYTDDFLSHCKRKRLEGDLEVPMTWVTTSDIIRYKKLSNTGSGNSSRVAALDGRTYLENSKVSESLSLMKFYSLSSGMVSHLLSGCNGKELGLLFELSDQEMEILVFSRSSFILGRSGTGKSTVLVMKLFQKEQLYHIASKGFHELENITTMDVSPGHEDGEEDGETKGAILRQLFVTVSPKLCYAVKQHVSQLKRLSFGGIFTAENSKIDVDDIDDSTEFNDIPDSFVDLPSKVFPLVITFHKFLMMLNGTVGRSYFERFPEVSKFSLVKNRSSKSVALQTFIRMKEVTYERFSSSYWRHINTQLTKRFDPITVFTEIISHIKGGFAAGNSYGGKLGREDYISLSKSRVSSLSMQEREAVYDIFLQYEKKRMERGEFDLADIVIDLHCRLRDEGYEGDKMDFVYIDEVQDLTMKQVALFKYICRNSEEGFVFAGDSAQTIAKGIDFRFQEIRSLFYRDFLFESRSSGTFGRKDKGKVSDMFQLRQNFRTHAGVLKLAQSIINLLYHFFPSSLDILSPETSLIDGEPPVCVESVKDGNAFITIFGNSGSGSMNFVGFGSEQVILVRDDCAKNEILDAIGKRALVLTIVECKGLEFQDVLLYNFFGSSPFENCWRVIYEYMKGQDLLDSSSPMSFPNFQEGKHNLLCSELKQLYVAITRTRQRLWIFENVEELSKPMFDYWKKLGLVQFRQLDDSLAQEMQDSSTPEEWKSRGMKLLHQHNFDMAKMCFERAREPYWEKFTEAAGLRAAADRVCDLNSEMVCTLLTKAAKIYDSIGKYELAAQCFIDSNDYEQAGVIYLEKCGNTKLEEAGYCFARAGCYKRSAKVYAKGNYFSECLFSCTDGKLFDMGLQYIQYWKRLASSNDALAKRSNEIEKSAEEFLERSARHYNKVKDSAAMMKFVKAFKSKDSMRTFLKTLGCLAELVLLEKEWGNFLEAANIAKLTGDFKEAGYCFARAGCYKHSAEVYARGNYFSECLFSCTDGKLFDMGLEYIQYWKRLASSNDALAKRSNEIEKSAEEFLERSACHYNKVKESAAMMKFVKAFKSKDSMRTFLKTSGCLAELVLLEKEWGNFLEAANIAKLTGDFKEAGYCFARAGCYKHSAEVYARGNYFSECLFSCTDGKLFDMGLEYIQYWKRLASSNDALAKRSNEIEKSAEEFLERSACHYNKVKESAAMMKFVKAFKSKDSMRTFLKTSGCLAELVLLEKEWGNFLEAANIAKLTGDFKEAGYCFARAGCYKHSAEVYARGNYFSECLFSCTDGKLFDMGLEYIQYWKRLASSNDALAKRSNEIEKSAEEFLERSACHYNKVKESAAMMKFVKAFKSKDSMRTFLKTSGCLAELVLLEKEWGNFLEAANIAKLTGDFKEAGYCFARAGCYKRSAKVYAKGNYFSECLFSCTDGKLFDMGLQYIQYWKRLASSNDALAKRSNEIEKSAEEFLERSARHYNKVKDSAAMMKFVKAFKSKDSMRTFLKTSGCLAELVLLEKEWGNFFEQNDMKAVVEALENSIAAGAQQVKEDNNKEASQNGNSGSSEIEEIEEDFGSVDDIEASPTVKVEHNNEASKNDEYDNIKNTVLLVLPLSIMALKYVFTRK